MTQHYPKPEDVLMFDEDKTYKPSKFLSNIIKRDGLIVPILVINSPVGFIAADVWQSERVLACRELGFETILVEDKWEVEDL